MQAEVEQVTDMMNDDFTVPVHHGPILQIIRNMSTIMPHGGILCYATMRRFKMSCYYMLNYVNV